MKQYDAIIIGFGKGGKTLAAELAKRKLDVAVVERSQSMRTKTLLGRSRRHTIVSPLQGRKRSSLSCVRRIITIWPTILI